MKSENLGKRRHVPSPPVVFEKTLLLSLLLYGILQKLFIGYWHPRESSSYYDLERGELLLTVGKKVVWDFNPCPIK